MLTETDGRELLTIARRAITDYLNTGTTPVIEPTSPALLRNAGAFVTLKQEDRLRGCIGLLHPTLPLAQTVVDMAIAAATRDSRFPPLAVEELADITIEISVLSPLKKIKDVSEIIVGEHGLSISKGFHQGVLLPQVASGQGWDLDTFLEYVCLKAGLNEEDWRRGASLFIFSAQIFSEQ
ncbi:MAG: AmmeMemoRadiSam system protein A [Thermodesulfobacteriota bacterium]